MNTKQLHYVLTLVHEGSFSKAADVLNITQPSLSQYIKKIEKEIGLELFNRTNGDIRITDAGRVYLEAGQKILNIEHQMENDFTDLRNYKTGSLIIGTAPYRAASMMPTIALSFRAIHPGMHLVVREGTTTELVEGMEHGEYDLVITLLPLDNRLFSWEKVVEEELVLAVPPSYPLLSSKPASDRRYRTINVNEIAGAEMVMLTETQFMQRRLDEFILEKGVKVKTAAVVKSLEAQIEFVKAGVGMAFVPSSIGRFCKKDDVTFYSFSDDLPKREVVVMWRKDRKLSIVAKELKDVIRSIAW